MTVQVRPSAKQVETVGKQGSAKASLVSDLRLTDRRNTEENQLKVGLDDSVVEEKDESMRQSPVKKMQAADLASAGTSHRLAGTSVVLKSLGGASRGRRD